MSARAAAVILTDTKSLSRFSVMKFSSVNVQSSPVVSRPPSLSSSLSLLRGTLAFIRRISLAARLRPLASFSHSHAHLYEHKRTHSDRLHADTEYRARQNEHGRSRRSTLLHVDCLPRYIWTHLFVPAAAEQRRGPHEYEVTYPDAPAGNQHPGPGAPVSRYSQ